MFQHAEKSLLCGWMCIHAVSKLLPNMYPTKCDTNGWNMFTVFFYMILYVTYQDQDIASQWMLVHTT